MGATGAHSSRVTPVSCGFGSALRHDSSLVHHRLLHRSRSRARPGRRGGGGARPGHRPQAGGAGGAACRVPGPGDHLRPRRAGSGRLPRRGAAGDGPAGRDRRAGEQRRIRAARDRRGDRRPGACRPAGHEPVRAVAADPAVPAVLAGPGRRGHHHGVVDRGPDRVSRHERLRRVEVRARRARRVARRGAGRHRGQRGVRAAGRVCHRVGVLRPGPGAPGGGVRARGGADVRGRAGDEEPARGGLAATVRHRGRAAGHRGPAPAAAADRRGLVGRGPRHDEAGARGPARAAARAVEPVCTLRRMSSPRGRRWTGSEGAPGPTAGARSR